MSDDQNPDVPQVVANRSLLTGTRIPGIRIAFWIGVVGILIAAAAFSRSGKRRAGEPVTGPPVPVPDPESVDQDPVVEPPVVEPPVVEPPVVEPPVVPAPVLDVPEAPEPAVAELPVPDEDGLDEPAEVKAPKRSRKGKRKRSTGGRVAFWTGIAMILAGLGLLAYVAWQLWGTNWASHKHQREITAQLQQDWEQDRGCTENCPTGKATALIRIPKFGRDYVVPVLEGVTPDVLAKGFGHFKESADAGEVGNYALAGHRVTHGEPLRKMPNLRPGDKVIVETRTATYTYVLDTDPNALIVPFTGVWVVDPLPKNPRAGGPQPAQEQGQRLITLTTCSELFHTDNRMISFGHLVAEVPKTTSAPGSQAAPSRVRVTSPHG